MQATPGVSAASAGLQSRLDAALAVGCADTVAAEALLGELAAAAECAAVIAVWDGLKAVAEPSEAAWAALDALHRRGKGKIPPGRLAVPSKGARTLHPGRRLHKIIKGRRIQFLPRQRIVFLEQIMCCVCPTLLTTFP